MQKVESFEKVSSQGDVAFFRADLLGIDSLPEDAIKLESENGRHAVAHSETGHHHSMLANDVDFYKSSNDEFKLYLVVHRETEIKHLKSFDTHAPIKFNPGLYVVRRQRERIPEGFRRASD